jgi:hypothetical protein
MSDGKGVFSALPRFLCNSDKSFTHSELKKLLAATEDGATRYARRQRRISTGKNLRPSLNVLRGLKKRHFRGGRWRSRTARP